MLDIGQELSYSLLKNLLLLPWILPLIVDMVNDSTPLLKDLLHVPRKDCQLCPGALAFSDLVIPESLCT